MKYLGSKRRIADELLFVVLEKASRNQLYIEPFCGGCNSMSKVPSSFKRIANDKHFYLIEMWKALVSGWIPPAFVSEAHYQSVRMSKSGFPPYEVGYIGFNSFGGKWFGGYPRSSTGKRDYWKEYASNVCSQALRLTDVEFKNKEFYDLSIPDGAVVYCDPPYQNTTEYGVAFDRNRFWHWSERLSERCMVFVSEYKAPEPFTCVWSKRLLSPLDFTHKSSTERLFTII